MASKKTSLSFKTALRHFRKLPLLLLGTFFLIPVLFIVTPSSLSFIPAPLRPPLSAVPIPVSLLPVSASLPVPAISARNVFIMDLTSKTVLYQKAAAAPVLPASTTKMMTALIALSHYPLDQIITISQVYPIGTVVGFRPGEQLSVEQLLYAMLVNSGNDAAEILAANFPGGAGLPAGRQGFIAAMNTTAAQLHLTRTHFVNPTGMDEPGHYSTAVDLVRLADVALRLPEFARIVSTENAVVSAPDSADVHILNNVNQLLGKIPGVKGIKTGNTPGAGQALVTLVERDNHPVIMAVLGSADRFDDTQKLIEWIYSNFTWKNINPAATD